jgi:hypothetical protein
MSKYIGGFEGDEMRPVTAAEVARVISENRQYGTRKETRVACMRILRRGDALGGSHGFIVRLARQPA